MALEQGHSLLHYRLVERIGEGGMGVVWKATDTKLGREVAIKLLPEALAADPQRLARFEREARALATLNHPNIVTIHTVERDGGAMFLVMEYVRGTPLGDLIPDKGFAVDRLLSFAIPLAEAIAEAHRHGVTHRDLKPGNVVVTDDGRPKVLDFGLAKLVAGDEARSDPDQVGSAETAAPATVAGLVLGTAAYMSPEQAEGRPVDARSDIFSFGVMLYEMATGRRPFGGETTARLVSSILRDDPPPIAGLRPDLPGDLEAVLRQCLEKDPESRVQTAADVCKRLQSLSGHAHVVTTPVTTVGQPDHPGKERTSSSVKVAIGLVAIVVVMATAWYVHVSQRPGDASLPEEKRAKIASPLAARKLSQLTFEVEPEQWPVWSPDGKRLVYCREKDGFSKLFMRDLKTGESRQLTHVPRDDIQPSWSPGGKSLVFVRSNTQGGKLEPSEPLTGEYSDGDVWMLDLESSVETRIIDRASNPVFSPDGAYIAVDASLAGPRRIWTTDARGRNPHQITTDTSEAVEHIRPAWSPDGKLLVYQHGEKTKFDIHVVEPATGQTVEVTDDLYLDLDPVWSSSGRHIYMSSYRGGGLNIWRIPVTSDGNPAGPPEQLTTGAGQDIQPSLAPGGSRLAYTVLLQNADLWRLPTNPSTGQRTGDAEPLVASTREDSRGAWSPDGRLLAFNSDRDGDMNIWLIDLADGTTRPLTRGPGGDYQPNWAPDGSKIAFFSARAGNADIWVVDVASGELRQITDDPALDTNPFFSPDGDRIAFQSDRDGRKEVWLANADGSEVRRLASVGASDHFMRWSDDGETLYFRSSALAQNSICRVPIDGGEAVPTGIPVGWHMSFSPDRSLLLDAVGHKGLWVYPMDGSERREVFVSDDPDVRIDYPEWSPDGRWVVFDRVVPRGGDVWLLEGLE